MDAILFSGFPGFLGNALLPRVLDRARGAEAVCLVPPQYLAPARARVAGMVAANPALADRVRLVRGDVTEPGLGLRDERLGQRVVEIFHLAAVHDLTASLDVAMAVNVGGTHQMLAFARDCPRLQRFQYVSTCYVSGRHPGTFTEDMLEEGQAFNNAYEESRQLAEVEVRRAMQRGVPVTVYRPSIVVGDSSTGATQEYDGPYLAIQWLLRQPRIAVIPVVGDARWHEFNVVPRDYVIDAIAWLAGRRESMGRTYALADPAPPTVDAMLEILAAATGRRLVRVKLPLGLVKWSLDRVPGMAALTRVPPSAVDYFVHPTRYGTAHARTDLEPAGIRCPHFATYAPRLVEFMRSHPEVGSGSMT